MVEDLDLPTGIVARREFTVEPSHTTNVFGDQEDPPARAAAADATPDESVRVLGTPALLAWVEFVARESLRGHLPRGTGCAGERAEVHHRRAVPLGTDLLVETDLVDVSGVRLAFEGTVSRTDGEVVGTASTVIRVVERDRFRASLADHDA